MSISRRLLPLPLVVLALAPAAQAQTPTTPTTPVKPTPPNDSYFHSINLTAADFINTWYAQMQFAQRILN